jgi:hypothetical protein
MARKMQSDELQALQIVQRNIDNGHLAEGKVNSTEFDWLRASVIMLANFYEDPGPVPMILTCPDCGSRHVDKGLFATKRHHTHACQFCGMVWRPAVEDTVGVQFLPGFKNEEKE